MPFAVFRRHQRKLLAIFAILAMFGFVLADSLPRLLMGGPAGGGDPVVVELYGKKVRHSEIAEMVAQRNRANLFISELLGQPGRPIFGDLSTRSIVDALILQHEADRLGMPRGPEVAREWLKARLGSFMNRDIFEATLSRFGNQVSGEQMLDAIANQSRIMNVRQLLGSPVVTPRDVFQAYREQNERVSARAVAFPVANYLAKIKDPAPSELAAFYDKYKDTLPDATRETPGFKIPRQVRVEVLSLDGTALMRSLKDRLTESELRSYYENRKAEFKQPSEFPDDLFADDPQASLTPPALQPFSEVRPYLSTALAEEKAQNEIVNKFGRIKDDVMIPFADAYGEMDEARKRGEAPKATLPKAESLKALAEKEGLSYEVTPLLSKEQAEHYGTLGDAEVGLTRAAGGRKFAAEMFDPKTTLYEPVELSNIEGRRFLVRKTEDEEPRIPPLEEIRAEVLTAWKTEQARPLAKQAAEEFARKLETKGGALKEDTVDGRPVLTIPAISRVQPGFPLPGRAFESGTPTPIPEVPDAGDEFREAYFGLVEGKVAVAPNQPKTIYYALSLLRRIKATFASLYAPNGEYQIFQREALTETARRRDRDWMTRLRAEAGLKPDWVPKDEADRRAEAG